ncbi:hypothetical protein ACJX0J_027506, partial [Zea mays]
LTDLDNCVVLGALLIKNVFAPFPLHVAANICMSDTTHIDDDTREVKPCFSYHAAMESTGMNHFYQMIYSILRIER